MTRSKKIQAVVDWLKRLLVHRHLPWIAMLAGILIGIPVLWTGWGISDDVIQRGIILSSPLSVVLDRLYVFLDPAINKLRMDAGTFPWWTYEGARIIFFRPVSAFSLWLDYQVWPNIKPLMHLHSLLLYGVLCFTAAHLFRRLMGVTTQAGLAALLFSLSTAHIGCVVSLAARNLLLTTIFGVLTILFHDRWRKEKWRPGLVLAVLCLLLSLFSAETGIATLAFLLAYVLFLETSSWRSRILSLLPYAFATIAWMAVYLFQDFGALGSGFYLSPLQEPLRFAIAVIERFPFILMGQWILPDPVVYTVLSNGARIVLWVLSVAILAFIFVLLRPLLKNDRMARFWTLGMLLSVVPVCAVSPASGRHLTFISLGAFALMGLLIVGRLQPLAWAPKKRFWRRAALWMSSIFLALHAVIYPFAGTFVRPTLDSYATAFTDIGEEPGMSSKDVILVNAPSPSLFIYLPSYRQFIGKPLPAHLRILAPGYLAVSLTTLDEHTVLIQPENGFCAPPVALSLEGEAFLPLFHPSYSLQYGDGLFRGQDYPMELGQIVNLTGVSVEITLLTQDGRPLAARASFDQPITDESLIWLMWDWSSSHYVPFQLPEVGETVLIPGPY